MRRIHFSQAALIPVFVILVAALFLAQTISTVVGPASRAHRLGLRLQRVRGHYIAEDVLMRALAQRDRLRSGEVVRVPEGELSNVPEREARAELRRFPSGHQMICWLERPEQKLVFLASYSRGVLPPVFTWAVGQGEESDLGFDAVVRGRQGALSSNPEHRNVHPLVIPGTWDVLEDIVVRASDIGASDANMNLANFRLAPELPIEHLAEPTDLDDFTIGRFDGERLVAAFRAKKDLIVRVRGHLWLGQKDRPMLFGTGGRSVVLYVSGNVYLRGDIRMVGPRDRLILMVGRPGWGAYRDRNGNGRRDAGEIAQPGSDADRLTPREGAGIIYVGLGSPHTSVQASMISRHDIVIGSGGALVQGSCLAGGRIVRCGDGPLELQADTRFRGATLPRKGLPVLPGTENQERVTQIRLVSSRR